ncbi:LuxR family transcriptional regulator [Roseovarius sp. SYSU LYC5161]|uniref:LuxR family transcriptional regulator n=1 Tax=Roseovarius halophilus (ex Wu et al. 2025) TaxID=3376060 RepID=UPI0028727499|nr:LuxR family transcriptional regulator [Roseovarius sp.]
MELDDLSQAKDLSTGIIRFLDQVRQKFELDDVAYAGLNPINGQTYGYVTYVPEWTNFYFENRLYDIDPTLSEARRSIAPVDWSRLSKSASFNRIFSAAREFGITNRGMSIPVRGPYGDIGGFSVTRDCTDQEWARLKEKIMGDLQTAAVHLHDVVIRSDQMMRTLNAPALSTREIEILQWTAAGKSQQDVADILSISHRTVEVHLRSARQKLSSLTTPQAVGRAINAGLVYPR